MTGLNLTHSEVLLFKDLLKNLSDREIHVSNGSTIRIGILRDKINQYERYKRPAKPNVIIWEKKENGSWLANVPKSLLKNSEGFDYVLDNAKSKLGTEEITWKRLKDDECLAGCSCFHFWIKKKAEKIVEANLDSMSIEDLKAMALRIASKLNK